MTISLVSELRVFFYRSTSSDIILNRPTSLRCYTSLRRDRCPVNSGTFNETARHAGLCRQRHYGSWRSTASFKPAITSGATGWKNWVAAASVKGLFPNRLTGPVNAGLKDVTQSGSTGPDAGHRAGQTKDVKAGSQSHTISPHNRGYRHYLFGAGSALILIGAVTGFILVAMAGNWKEEHPPSNLQASAPEPVDARVRESETQRSSEHVPRGPKLGATTSRPEVSMTNPFRPLGYIRKSIIGNGKRAPYVGVIVDVSKSLLMPTQSEFDDMLKKHDQGASQPEIQGTPKAHRTGLSTPPASPTHVITLNPALFTIEFEGGTTMRAEYFLMARKRIASHPRCPLCRPSRSTQANEIDAEQKLSFCIGRRG